MKKQTAEEWNHLRTWVRDNKTRGRRGNGTLEQKLNDWGQCADQMDIFDALTESAPTLPCECGGTGWIEVRTGPAYEYSIDVQNCPSCVGCPCCGCPVCPLSETKGVSQQ